MNLNALSNSEILSKLKILVKQERELLSEILQHLMIVEDRKLHLAEGYSSLFEYTVEALHYNEAQAYRRIAAMRVLRDLPEVKERVENGKINLTQLTQAKQFFQVKSKSAEALSKDEKMDLISSLENKSTRETERIFADLAPEEKPRDKERVLSKEWTMIQFSANETLMQKLKRFKELDAHSIPNPDYAELFERLVDLALAQKNKTIVGTPKKHSDGRQALGEPKFSAPKKHDVMKSENKVSRAIPIEIKRKVHARDEGKCSFINPLTKKRCGSRFQIQFEHHIPYALGGEHSIENLKLDCSNHNLWMAEKQFGREKMRSYVRK